MDGPYLSIENVSKSFGKTQVVRGADIAVGKGEFVSLLGPSGCGKTTILRMVAGFETPTSGRILIDGKDVTSLKPNQRNIGMVFQSYALFPNMTVAGNIGFGLRVAGVPAAEAAKRVTEMLALIKLPQLADRFPWQLSGGQQQRVALARAIAPRPSVLLLDEPLSALDAKIRVSLRAEIGAIQRALGITTIFVTHDQEEALSMSDRVVVMNEGHIEQIGTPFEVYNRPATRFAAQFVGTLSILNAKVENAAKGEVSLGGASISGLKLPSSAAKGAAVSLAVRPEAVAFKAAKGDVTLSGKIIDVDFLGSVIRIKLAIGSDTISLDTFNDPSSPPPKHGDTVSVSFDRESLLVLGEKSE
jgi:putative spermidine/putrescine transport system ATP-binding protein